MRSRTRWISGGIFKSHHSGMETEWLRGQHPPILITLNRTIVGWKLCWLFTSAEAGNMTLNRTIVGWKQNPGIPSSPGRPPLNRTIVGWKLR